MSTEAHSKLHIRSPLRESTNDLRIQDAAAPPDDNMAGKSKTLRNKESKRALHPEIDSSESFPSSHGSIFEALYCGRNGTQHVDGKPGFIGTFITGGLQRQSSEPSEGITHRTSIHIENAPAQSIHLPTPLETITEQKSFATLRSRASFFSLRQKRSFPLLRKKPSLPVLRPNPSLSALPAEGNHTVSTEARSAARRKQSFSVDDITFTRHLTRIFNSSSSTSDNTALADTSSKYPILPKDYPPPRMPTPPGLPTFNTPGAAAYRLPAPHIGFRDFVRGRRTPEELQYRAQTSRLPPGAVMRGPDGVIVRGRWRPSQSGHTGNVRFTSGERGLAGHPLHGAPLATVSVPPNIQLPVLNDVGNLLPGISSSTPIHDSMTASAPMLGDSTPTRTSLEPCRSSGETFVDRLAYTPLQASQLSGQETRSRWMRFREACCFCCAAIKDEEGLLQTRLVPLSMHGGIAGGYCEV